MGLVERGGGGGSGLESGRTRLHCRIAPPEPVRNPGVSRRGAEGGQQGDSHYCPQLRGQQGDSHLTVPTSAVRPLRTVGGQSPNHPPSRLLSRPQAGGSRARSVAMALHRQRHGRLRQGSRRRSAGSPPRPSHPQDGNRKGPGLCAVSEAVDAPTGSAAAISTGVGEQGGGEGRGSRDRDFKATVTSLFSISALIEILLTEVIVSDQIRDMPRAARLVLPGIPHHVTQRGNRKQRTFFVDSDFRLYLSLLRHWCRRSGTALWAWCVMPNHVHAILVPSSPDGLRGTLAPAHRRYSWEINQRQGWRGNLWQGRFASFPMDEAHLHACLRYVELNPVRAGLVDRPEQWPWSHPPHRLRRRRGPIRTTAAAAPAAARTDPSEACASPCSARASSRRSRTGPASAPPTAPSRSSG